MFMLLQNFRLQKLHEKLQNIKYLKVFTEYDLAVVQSSIILSRGKISLEAFVGLNEYSNYLRKKMAELVQQEKNITGLIQSIDKNYTIVR